MRIKIISYLLLTSLTFQNFSFFSLQRTTQKNNALKEFVMLQSGNNHKEKKSTLDVQEQKQCILKIDAGGKNFIIFDSPNLELFVVELLKKASAQQRQYHLSEDLLQVCQKVLDKQKKFSLQEIAKALPEMLSFALAKIEETKAPLLDAPGLQDGSAECDVDQAMQLLNQLINIVIQCCNTLQVDFAGTFTFLTTILPEINGTFTVLDEIINTLTIDFNGTFTALIDIKNTLTIDFNGTFTALEACCEAIFFDFNGVFTTLTDIDNTVIVDFNGTFTTLDDLKNTMTTDFNETFTALQACCEATFEDFNGTFTALEDSTKTILAQLAVSTAMILEQIQTLTQTQAQFNGTFTVINSLSNQLTDIQDSLVLININIAFINDDLVTINNDLTTIDGNLTTVNNNLTTVDNALNEIAENAINCLASTCHGCDVCPL
jgi:hypothetical protein